MSLLKAFRARWRALIHRRAADADLQEEIRFHLELETEKNVRLGMSRDEAARIARVHFGGVDSTREAHRDVRRLAWIEDFVTDARFALRTMRRTPGLALSAVLTLALGIGANVAIFSAVNAVVLQPLPFPKADRLVVIGEDNPEKHWHMQTAAPANMLDWRAGVSDFVDVMGYVNGLVQSTLSGQGDPRVLNTSIVTGNFFSTLGVHPQLGRSSPTTSRGVGRCTSRCSATGRGGSTSMPIHRSSATRSPSIANRFASSASCRRPSRFRSRTSMCGAPWDGLASPLEQMAFDARIGCARSRDFATARRTSTRMRSSRRSSRASSTTTPARIDTWARRCSLCMISSSVTRGYRSSCSCRRSPSCCSSRAPTSATCSSSRQWVASAKPRYVSRSARSVLELFGKR